MKSQLLFWWKKIKEHPISSIAIFITIIGAIALIVVIILGYYFDWDWTGLGPYTSPNSNYQRGKTLWDWLNLLGVLAIPAVVGFATVWFTKQQAKESATQNEDNQREAALQDYIGKLSELLLEKNLRKSLQDDEVRKVARVRTLTTLSQLDIKRKGSIVQFLYEINLIDKDTGIIDLTGADLNKTDLSMICLIGVDLTGAYLNGANLNGTYIHEASLVGTHLNRANLSGANLNKARMDEVYLNEANLSRANLSETFLTRAHLSNANLSGANLSKSYLCEANLTGADLTGTYLVEAYLFRAIITTEQLNKAKSLKGATMPDGSIHP